MLIKRTSQLTGVSHELEIPITPKQYQDYLDNPGMLIQNAFPDLEAPLREYIKSGITPEEWEEKFGKNPFNARKVPFLESDDDELKDDDDVFDEENWPEEYYDRDLGGTGHGDISYSDADPGL